MYIANVITVILFFATSYHDLALALDIPPPTEEDCQLASPSAPNPFLGQCGRFNALQSSSSNFQGRVIGGSNAARAQFPWQVRFRAKES